jgi:hypothetical protein
VSKVSLDLRDYLNLPDLLGLTDIANDKTSAVCSGTQLASNASINFVQPTNATAELVGKGIKFAIPRLPGRKTPVRQQCGRGSRSQAIHLRPRKTARLPELLSCHRYPYRCVLTRPTHKPRQVHAQIRHVVMSFRVPDPRRRDARGSERAARPSARVPHASSDRQREIPRNRRCARRARLLLNRFGAHSATATPSGFRPAMHAAARNGA